MTTTFRRARSGLYIPRGSLTYDQQILTSSPAQFFKFDEGPAGATTNGQTLVDYSGNGNNGSYNGTNTTLSGGSGGATFAGNSGSYATLSTTGLPSGNSPYTVEIIFSPTTASDVDLFVFGTNSSNQANGFEINPVSGEFRNWWSGSNVTTSGASITNGGGWRMATCVYDQSTLTVYMEGVSKGSASRSSHNTTFGAAYVARNLALSNFYVGAIRRLSIFTTAHSAATVAARASVAPLT